MLTRGRKNGLAARGGGEWGKWARGGGGAVFVGWVLFRRKRGGVMVLAGWGGGGDFQELDHCPHFGFMVSFGTVPSPLGVSFGMLMYYCRDPIVRL